MVWLVIAAFAFAMAILYVLLGIWDEAVRIKSKFEILTKQNQLLLNALDKIHPDANVFDHPARHRGDY